MKASVYKAGMRVVLIKADLGDPVIGGIGTVIEKIDERLISVAWDNFDAGHDGERGDGSRNCWTVGKNQIKEHKEIKKAAIGTLSPGDLFTHEYNKGVDTVCMVVNNSDRSRVGQISFVVLGEWEGAYRNKRFFIDSASEELTVPLYSP